MNKNIKAITIGDINGIGIKLLINIWKFKRKIIGPFILITNYNLFNKYIKKNKIKIPYLKIHNFSKIKIISDSYIPIFHIEADTDIMNTYNSIIYGYYLTKKKHCESLITLPINKEKIIKNVDKNFMGQTELLQKLDNKKYSNMIFYSKNIIITTLTTHIPLNKINYYLKNTQIIEKKIYSIYKTLKIDFNILKPKIVICGLNPHAGENGNIGKEEKKFLNPVIMKLNKKGVNIEGPFSADTIFNTSNRKKYDCFICIYHDQALIPFKIFTKNTGINYTGSLDIIRTSPAHGTAYNLINTNKASTKCLINSFLFANKILKNRKKNINALS